MLTTTMMTMKCAASAAGEVKTLLLQLLRGVQHLHDNWIIHRDLKASNLLLSHKGILKVGNYQSLQLCVGAQLNCIPSHTSPP